MTLNLALVVSGNYQGAKDAAQQTKAEIGSIRAEAVSASAAMASANDQAVASSRRVTEALASQAAAERNLRAEIDRRLSVGSNVQQVSTPFANDALRGADIDAYGRSLDALRARFNPIYAAIAQYKTAVMEARQAERLGAISADEMTAAIGRQRQATLASIAAIKSRQAANQNGAAGGPNFAALNATSQFQDIAITSLMGQSPLTIALQQGTQLGMAMQASLGEGGAAGAANVLKSALFGLFTPVNLVAIGLTAVVAAGIQFGSKLFPQVKSLDDLMKQHEETLKDLGNAYGDVAAKSKGVFSAANQNSFGLAASNTINGLRLGIAQANRDALSQILIDRGTGGSGNQFGPAQIVGSEFAPFTDAIEHLRQTARNGQPDILGFRKMVEDKWALTPNDDAVTKAAGKLIEFTKDAAGAAKALLELEIIKRRLFDDVGPNGFLLSRGTSNQADMGNLAAFEAQQAVARARVQQGFNADVLGINARSPEERAAAARASAAASYNNDETPAARSQRIELAGKKALIEAEHQLTIAQQERMRSLDQTIASAQLDASLIGKSTAETEALRFENERLAQVREEAARNGVQVDQAEIASIHAKSVEYGKLIALQDARSKIRDQQDDLELQRAELGLVGQSTLAHDRAIAALKTEQEIRRLGIPLYGQEAEAMRANTAARSDLAEQTAKATLQQQLLFERQQMFRSSIEQTVAATMKSAGLEYDPNSMIAQQIRYNEQLKTTKAAWEDIFNTVNDGLDGISDALFSGGSIEEALRKAGSQLAKTIFDMSLTNPLKNWLTGGNFNTIGDLGIFPGAWSGKGGGFGGVLGQMLGAQKAVASMQVQAASVFINGAPLGVPGLGSIGNLIKPDGSPIVGPNTAESSAKLLAGLGSPLGFGTDSAVTNSIAGSASGNSVAAQIWNFFAAKGLKPFQIAGILGNVKAESAFNPLAAGDGGNALGLFQWNDRAPAMLNAIGGRGNLGDIQAQLQFAWKELQSSEGMALKKLLGSTDVRGATAAFAGFERPQGFSWANPENAHNFIGRLSGAESALARFGGSASTATTAVSQLGGASSSVMSSLVSSTSTAAKGLDVFGNGAGKLGSALSQFPAAPAGGGGGGGLFGWLGSLFGLGGGGGGLSSAFSGTAAFSWLSANPGGFIGLYANGAAFNRGNVVPFARGDVFSTPTYFPMSAGRTGVLGEDGEEAIMPLQRGPDGRLGVVNHQPLRAPRAANSNTAGGGSGGGLTRAHIEGIVDAISSRLKFSPNIINLNDGSDIKRYLMSEDGHSTIAAVNKRIGGG